MVKSYFVLAYRNLLRNRAASWINIFGLSIAIATGVVVFLFVDTQFSMDAFHPNVDRIFLIENVFERNGELQTWGNTPTPLGPVLEREFPQVERVVRIQGGYGVFQYEDTVLNESLWFVEPDFLEMFDFPLKYGDKSALYNQDAIILSEQAALRYFGDSIPLGQAVTIRFDDRHLESFIVGGVAGRFPEEASFKFNILINYDKQRDLGSDLEDWKAFTLATFVQVKNAADINVISRGLRPYIQQQNSVNPDLPVREFTFENLRTLSRNSFDVWNDISASTHPAGLVLLPLIAIFLLILACFNYMNISIAAATRRMKEIGVRKVVGASRIQFVWQFLSENLVLCMLSLALGTALAHFVLLPQFNTFFEAWPQLKISLAGDIKLWLFLIVLLVFTAAASGVYPALYISSFKAANIFRGRQQISGKGALSRVLLTFQFTLSFLTMLAGVVIAQNVHYQGERDWGYEKENVLVLPLEKAEQFTVMENALGRDSNVLSISGSHHHIMGSDSYAVIDVAGEKVGANRYEVGFGYLEALGMELDGGRFFDTRYGTDEENAVIINETFARNQGWATPTGRQIRIGEKMYTIIGLVRDFHHYPFFDPIRPVVFTIGSPVQFEFLVMRFRAGSAVQTVEKVRRAWQQHFPGSPYRGFFQDSVFDGFYRTNSNLLKIIVFAAVMAIVLSCMGLFGLASQAIARRTKEISIRKVFGASVAGVAGLVSRPFLLLLLVSAILAAPLAYFGLSALLESIYAFYLPVTVWPFGVAFVLVFVIAMLTISTQVRKIAFANPADILRSE